MYGEFLNPPKVLRNGDVRLSSHAMVELVPTIADR
jgi:hypothetical protein